MKIEYVKFTSPGFVRSINQDSIFADLKNDYGLFAIADGMGGHSFGEVASGRLIDALSKWWDGFLNDACSFEKCCEDIRQVLINVNAEIYNEFTSKGNMCGTTVAIVFIFSDRVFLVNSGDTRIYGKYGLGLKQESHDHIYGREAVILGIMTEKEVRMSPDRNKLTAAVGSQRNLQMYAVCKPLKSDGFFICSDGVYKYCKKSIIKSAMRKRSPEKSISMAVSKMGAKDNYSFIRIKLVKDKMNRS